MDANNTISQATGIRVWSMVIQALKARNRRITYTQAKKLMCTQYGLLAAHNTYNFVVQDAKKWMLVKIKYGL